jgi:nicotinate-nucleotide pyrophosphorylase (carboxylating)
MTPATLSRLKQAGLDVLYVQDLTRAALTEDEASYDVTSRATVPAEAMGTADVRARSAGVLAGVAVAIAVLDVATSGTAVVLEAREDGSRIGAGDVALTVRASLRELLAAERTMLNLVCHLSGIATLTREWVDAVEGTGAVVRDTRKTTPGLRRLEKWAVRCGGGQNHRMSLADAALIKDNHVVAAGGVEAAFLLVRERFPDLAVEVECDTLEQVKRVVAAGADLVLLDNMDLATMVASVQVCTAAGVRTEASGGLSLAGAREVALTGVDFLAVGALTHSAPVLDLGLDLRDS